jgi:hypothetical protein
LVVAVVCWVGLGACQTKGKACEGEDDCFANEYCGADDRCHPGERPDTTRSDTAGDTGETESDGEDDTGPMDTAVSDVGDGGDDGGDAGRCADAGGAAVERIEFVEVPPTSDQGTSRTVVRGNPYALEVAALDVEGNPVDCPVCTWEVDGEGVSIEPDRGDSSKATLTADVAEPSPGNEGRKVVVTCGSAPMRSSTEFSLDVVALPSNLGDALLFWLSGRAIVSSDGFADQIEDRSRSQNDFFARSASKFRPDTQPSVAGNSLNGHAYLTFDGGMTGEGKLPDDLLYRPGQGELVSSREMSVVALVRLNGSGPSGQDHHKLLTGCGSKIGKVNFQLQIGRTITRVAHNVDPDDPNVDDTESGKKLTVGLNRGEWEIIALSLTRSAYRAARNDQPTYTSKKTTKSVNHDFGFNQLGHWCEPERGSQNAFHGDLAELMVFETALTDEQRLTVVDSLAAKFGISLGPSPP